MTSGKCGKYKVGEAVVALAGGSGSASASTMCMLPSNGGKNIGRKTGDARQGKRSREVEHGQIPELLLLLLLLDLKLTLLLTIGGLDGMYLLPELLATMLYLLDRAMHALHLLVIVGLHSLAFLASSDLFVGFATLLLNALNVGIRDPLVLFDQFCKTRLEPFSLLLNSTCFGSKGSEASVNLRSPCNYVAPCDSVLSAPFFPPFLSLLPLA